MFNRCEEMANERSESQKLEIKELEKWADRFNVVSHPVRLAILFMLYGSDLLPSHKSLTFTEILAVLGLPKNNRAENSLSYHLGKLIESGFIKKEPMQEVPGKTSVQIIYNLSTEGREFLEDFNMTEVIARNLKARIL